MRRMTEQQAEQQAEQPERDADVSPEAGHEAGHEATTALNALFGQQLGIDDQAYLLHLRGHSLRAIAVRLHIDKDTAHKYVRDLAKEHAPKRKEARERLLGQAVTRLRDVQARASDQFDVTGEAALLNTMTTCEREIAKLHGLYDQVSEDAASGITITITRRTSDGDRE